MSKLPIPAREHGAALLVCLIILVLVTLMGLTSMRTSVLQEKMSGANSDKTLALQAAERALRDAEARIRHTLTSTSGFAAGCRASLCLAPMDGTTAADTVDWDSNRVATYADNDDGPRIPGVAQEPIAGVARQPNYIIELLFDMKPLPGNSENIKQKGTPYRITAVGYGKLARTRVQIQSTFYKP